MSMKLPRNFYKPLAIGAPTPYRELPVHLERMIHFVPPHIEKVRSKVSELLGQVDVVLGNLEDAIPADAKEAARRGFIQMAHDNNFESTGLWVRINALNSPWVVDDVFQMGETTAPFWAWYLIFDVDTPDVAAQLIQASRETVDG